MPIKQPKGFLDIYTLKSSFCIPQLSGTFGVLVGRIPKDDWRQSLPKFQDAVLIRTYQPVSIEVQYAALTGVIPGGNGCQLEYS